MKKHFVEFSVIKLSKYFLFCFVFFLNYSCKNELEDSFSSTPGIVPESTDQVVDIFELTYSDMRECTYNGQIFKFSIVDIIDSLVQCSETGYNLNSERNRIHTYLRVEFNSRNIILKVSSAPNGACFYSTYDFDIYSVQNLLKEWQEIQLTQNNWLFSSNFGKYFGIGTMIDNTTFSIHIAQAYAQMHHHQKDKSVYKFIFIITN